MEEWKEYKLGDLCNTISDTYKRGAKEVVLINTSDVLEGKCLNHAKVPNEKLKGQFKKTFQYNDILYSEIRPANKRFAFVDFDATDYIASTKLMVLRHNDKITPKYLYYILKSQSVIEELQMLAESRSGTFPQITFSELFNLKVWLPSPKMQTKIISILSSLDDKIETNRRINEHLEELAQALFKSWFVDFEPFKDGNFVESELGMIPEGWKVGELSDVLYISKDSINPSKTPDNLFHHYSIPAYDNNKREEAQEGKTIMSNKFKVTNKTTLFSKLNPRIKRVWFIDNVKENAICSTEFVPYKAKNNELTYFVYGLINSDFFYNQAMSIVNGATGSHQRFHPQDTLKFNIAFNESVAKEYSSIVEPIVSKILVNQQEITHLATLRDTLLPKLMSGEIDVNEVEI